MFRSAHTRNKMTEIVVISTQSGLQVCDLHSGAQLHSLKGNNGVDSQASLCLAVEANGFQKLGKICFSNLVDIY